MRSPNRLAIDYLKILLRSSCTASITTSTVPKPGIYGTGTCI